MMKNPSLSAALLIASMFLAGCGKGGDDPAGQSDGWSIAAGHYGNMASADQRRFAVHLPRGDRSEQGGLLSCFAEKCLDEQGFTARRGLNGISFVYQEAGRTVDVTITPVSPNSVMISGDWGSGLETAILPKVEQPAGE